MNQNIFHDVDMQAVLSPKMLPIWDNFSLGIVIVDANGMCCYMNKLQKDIDGFSHMHVIGNHISRLYHTHNVTELPTLECLRTQKPLLKKVYWYKTNKNKLLNANNDFFPLFNKGKIDGVISFTNVLGINSFVSPRNSDSNKPDNATLGFEPFRFEEILGKSNSLQKLIQSARLVAKSPSPVIIWGESGTGKDLFAQAIHTESNRMHRPFIPINCAAIPENLLESILFGTSKGSYTDAVDKTGLFEEAHGGTLVLDELNSMPMGLQAKLLRVIQEKCIRRIGAHTEIPIDVRIISILNEHPLHAIEHGRLRRDLYYRLAVVSLPIPPLHQRKADIPILVKSFMEELQPMYGHDDVQIDDEVMQLFMDYSWPGNIRELHHIIEGTLATLGNQKYIYPSNLPSHFNLSASDWKKQSKNGIFQHHESAQNISNGIQYFDYQNIDNKTSIPLKSCVQEYEERCIRNVLHLTGGNIAKASRIFEMTPSSLHYRIKTLGINLESF